MKKIIVIVIYILTIGLVLSGCSSSNSAFNVDKDISVISREDGSGTRGAFVELLEIEKKDDNGGREDLTTKEAVITNKTDVMLNNIANDIYSIGYLSLGSMNESIKKLEIDGVEANAENIKAKRYKLARAFNIVIDENTNPMAMDFINYILSNEGQEIVSNRYVSVTDANTPYVASKEKRIGKVVVAGSSSVAPVMEQLKEGYMTVNPNVEVEVQISDSTSGIKGKIDGICDIGMSSRSLKESELENLKSIEIALDGIIVCVNKKNSIENISSESLQDIFTGKVVKWNEVKNLE